MLQTASQYIGLCDKVLEDEDRFMIVLAASQIVPLQHSCRTLSKDLGQLEKRLQRQRNARHQPVAAMIAGINFEASWVLSSNAMAPYLLAKARAGSSFHAHIPITNLEPPNSFDFTCRGSKASPGM
jgi:hypothetical protein